MIKKQKQGLEVKPEPVVLLPSKYFIWEYEGNKVRQGAWVRFHIGLQPTFFMLSQGGTAITDAFVMMPFADGLITNVGIYTYTGPREKWPTEKTAHMWLDHNKVQPKHWNVVELFTHNLPAALAAVAALTPTPELMGGLK